MWLRLTITNTPVWFKAPFSRRTCDLAAIQANRKDFFIVGIDGSPDVVPFLKNPNSLIAATAAQDPYTMAEKAVEIGYNIINGKKPEQQLTLIPVELITKENVN